MMTVEKLTKATINYRKQDKALGEIKLFKRGGLNSISAISGQGCCAGLFFAVSSQLGFEQALLVRFGSG